MKKSKMQIAAILLFLTCLFVTVGTEAQNPIYVTPGSKNASSGQNNTQSSSAKPPVYVSPNRIKGLRAKSRTKNQMDHRFVLRQQNVKDIELTDPVDPALLKPGGRVPKSKVELMQLVGYQNTSNFVGLFAHRKKKEERLRKKREIRARERQQIERGMMRKQITRAVYSNQNPPPDRQNFLQQGNSVDRVFTNFR